MVKIAVFWGCRTLTSQYAYEMSIRQVLSQLGIELVESREASCCGDPVKSVNNFAATYLAARTLALAGSTGLKELLVPCSRCHLTLSETEHALRNDEKLLEKVATLLGEEKFEYATSIRIWHVIDLLHDVVGLELIKSKVKRTLKGLKLASHVGCQIIRPSDIGRADESERPRKLDELIEALGAESIEYSEKLDCCGAALMFSHQEAALTLSGLKLKALQDYGVDGVVDSCPAGHIMFDVKQESAGATVGRKLALPVVYYTQLLGVAMQIGIEKLGLHLNQSPVNELLVKIGK